MVIRPAGIGRRTRRPAQERSNAGQQLGRPEWLGDVIVGTELEGLDLRSLGVAGRKHEDRRLGLPPDPSDQLRPVAVRQAQIEEDDVRSACRPAGERRFHVVCLVDVVTAGGKVPFEGGPRRVLILDEQDARSRLRHGIASACWGTSAGIEVDGRSMSTASPPSSLRRAATRPPIAWTNPRTTARPMPVPDVPRRPALPR